jgi:predicted acetyltransferase
MPALKDSFVQALREFQAEGLPWHLALDASAVEADFASFANSGAADDYRHPEHGVLQTKLWAVWEGEFAGLISIRHELTDALRAMGGHIGYDTRPTLRGRGIASAMLGAALPVAKSIGLDQVLLTCDDTNIPSIRVIEKNGGVLKEKRAPEPGRPLKRYYWIEL